MTLNIQLVCLYYHLLADAVFQFLWTLSEGYSLNCVSLRVAVGGGVVLEFVILKGVSDILHLSCM